MSKGKRFNTPHKYLKNLDAWHYINGKYDFPEDTLPLPHHKAFVFKCGGPKYNKNKKWYFRNKKKYKELVNSVSYLGFNKFRAIEIWNWD